MSTTEKELLSTTDGMIWAKAFKETVWGKPDLAVDVGFLVGWFANAIETGRDAGRREHN